VSRASSSHILVSLILLLAACNTLPDTSTPAAPDAGAPAVIHSPTVPPSPTVEERPSPRSENDPAPLTEATPAILIETINDLFTPTPLPPVVSMPLAQVSIFNPGPGSFITSPIQVAGWGGPSYLDRVEIRLRGEDGRVLVAQKGFLLVLPGNAGRFYQTISFETDLVAEAGRLEVSIQSIRDRQLTHMASVDVTILSVGNPLVHPAIRGPEKLAIFYPRPEMIIEEGQVLVRGAGWVDSDTPLNVTILNNRGEPLGSAQVVLDAPAVGQLGTFEVVVPYKTSFPQWAHIVVSEPSTGSIPGPVHISSVEVWLRP
jgi:hypothetical protein